MIIRRYRLVFCCPITATAAVLSEITWGNVGQRGLTRRSDGSSSVSGHLLANSLCLGKPFCRTCISMWLASANLIFGRQLFTFCRFHPVPFAVIAWNSSSDSIHLKGWFLICNISAGLMFPSLCRLGFFSLKMRSLAEFKQSIRSHDSFHQCVGS